MQRFMVAGVLVNRVVPEFPGPRARSNPMNGSNPMKLKRLFQVLVVGGTAMMLTHCGGPDSGPNADPNSRAQLTDGGTKDAGTSQPSGGPSNW